MFKLIRAWYKKIVAWFKFTNRTPLKFKISSSNKQQAKELSLPEITTEHNLAFFGKYSAANELVPKQEIIGAQNNNKDKSEQAKNGQAKNELIKQEQVKQEQVKQEQVKQEQVKQEQVKQEHREVLLQESNFARYYTGYNKFPKLLALHKRLVKLQTEVIVETTAQLTQGLALAKGYIKDEVSGGYFAELESLELKQALIDELENNCKVIFAEFEKELEQEKRKNLNIEAKRDLALIQDCMLDNLREHQSKQQEIAEAWAKLSVSLKKHFLSMNDVKLSSKAEKINSLNASNNINRPKPTKE